MRRILTILLIIELLAKCQSDELISTRCQSKCLHLMDHRLQDHAEHRKNLKHHIIQMCKDDETCSACSAPCREQFDNVKGCKKSCVSSDDPTTCESSCDYLQTIYGEKPGACPVIKNQSIYECSALCHLDGDCPETQKCCSYGCSRQCARPKSGDIKRLLPIPRNITVQERKRKRSIIIRWSTGKWSKTQQADNSNLFLVQWRWGLQTDESTMTEWQTVTVRNKPYAILKHLLSPGRFYQFRIAAVSSEGSLGFSVGSEPFKISKEARAPSPPTSISLGSAKLTPIGLWNQQIRWNPPSSDLPIKNYQISWASSTEIEAVTFEEMLRKKATLEFANHQRRAAIETSDDDDESMAILTHRDRHSVIVPSHSTHFDISGLFPNSVYIVEIHASVDSSDGELHGEKGIIFIRTSDASASSTIAPSSALKMNDDKSEELSIIEDQQFIDLSTTTTSITMTSSLMPKKVILEIEKPFFDGELQTRLNWMTSPFCENTKKFVVRIRKTLCREYQPNHHSDTRWHDLRVDQCSAVLKGLSFDCDYKVEVSVALTGEPVVDGIFGTDTCEMTSSLTPITCATLTTPIQCQVTSESSAHCHWTRHHDSMQTIIGYRILLSSPISHDTNTTINQPQLREVRYENLRSGIIYSVEVQSITNKGLGRTVSTQFVTHSDLDRNLIERFPGGEIVELPLESSSSLSQSSILLKFLLVFLLLLLRFF